MKFNELSKDQKLIRLTQMRNYGYSYKDISEYYNTTEDTIRKFLDRNAPKKTRTLEEIDANPVENITTRALTSEVATVEALISKAKFVLFRKEEDVVSEIPIIIYTDEELKELYAKDGVTIYDGFIKNLEDTLKTMTFKDYKNYRITLPAADRVEANNSSKDARKLRNALIALLDELEANPYIADRFENVRNLLN